MTKELTTYEHPTYTIVPRTRAQLPSTISDKYVNKLLNQAADRLERGRWCQGAIGNNANETCLVGSLLNAELGGNDNVYNETQPYRHPITTAAITKLANHLDKMKALPPPSRFLHGTGLDLNFDSVSLWNDAKGRTKAEVIELLRDAAKE